MAFWLWLVLGMMICTSIAALFLGLARMAKD